MTRAADGSGHEDRPAARRAGRDRTGPLQTGPTRRRPRRALAVLAALLAASCGRPPLLTPPGADIDWSKAEPVTVALTEYRFAPDHLRFRRGAPYRLHLDNTGGELHEFTAPAFFRTVTLLNPEVLAGSGDVVLQPKQQKDVFFVPRRPGRYDLACADHDWEGMVGDITVE